MLGCQGLYNFEKAELIPFKKGAAVPIAQPPGVYHYLPSNDRRTIFAFSFEEGKYDTLIIRNLLSPETGTHRFKFNHDPGRTAYWRMFEDSKGRLYLAIQTEKAINLFNTATGKVKKIAYKIRGVTLTDWTGFFENQEGQVYFLTEHNEKGYDVIDALTGEISSIKTSAEPYYSRQLLKTRDGKNLLFAQAHLRKSNKPAMLIVDLDEGLSYVIPLQGANMWAPTLIRETDGGRIEAFYVEKGAYESVQLFGPPSEK